MMVHRTLPSLQGFRITRLVRNDVDNGECLDDRYAIDTMSTPVYFDMYCVEPKWLASNDTGLL